MLRDDEDDFEQLDTAVLHNRTIENIQVLNGEDWIMSFTDGSKATVRVLDNDDGSGQPILTNFKEAP